jgi:hypothetical protein
MIAQIAEIVAPVFLLTLAGWVWTRRGLGFDVEFVTRLAVNFATPFLIFSVLTNVEIDPVAFRDIALASVAAYAAVGAATTAWARIAGLDRRVYLAPLIFGNTGNMGLPLALFAFGEIGLAYAIVVFAVMAVVAFTIGVWLVAGGGSPNEALKQPIVHASVLGMAAALLDYRLPDWANNSAELAGQMAIPLMLVTLGVAIAKLTVRDVGRMVALSTTKLAIGVAAGLAALRWPGMDPVAAKVLFLQLVMPVAVTSYMLAERYRADPASVAGLVVVSTLISVLASPAVLAFLI